MLKQVTFCKVPHRSRVSGSIGYRVEQQLQRDLWCPRTLSEVTDYRSKIGAGRIAAYSEALGLDAKVR